MRHVLPPRVPANLPADKTVGITTSVPIEVLYAAGLVPVDLNNLFIGAEDPVELIALAERSGFPRTCCCWTKGLYGAVRRHDVKCVLGVTRGDCANTEALLEVLEHEGVRCLRFNYPQKPEAGAMQRALQELAAMFEADLNEAEKWRERLAPARSAAAEIDRLSWRGLTVRGKENHLWLVSASDFCADPYRYRREAEHFLSVATGCTPVPYSLRLGYCGVPPIVPDIYDFLESLGALVVYNETQRQFAMLQAASLLADQYSRYTYPYGVFRRIEDIRIECRQRGLDGVIHYVQSFCHRRIEDRIIRERLPVPVLTLEADRPGPLSGQLKTRLEAFVQILLARKEAAPLV